MKLTSIFLMVLSLQVSAEGFGQGVTLSEKNVPLKKIFREVHRQTGYEFFYNADLLDKAGNVSIEVKNASVEEVLALCFKDLPLTFTVNNKAIVVKAKPAVAVQLPAATRENAPLLITVRGRIINENGEPVQASVIAKGTKNGTVTNPNGEFRLADVEENATLVISGVSIETFEVRVAPNPAFKTSNGMTLTAKNKITEGEEVVVAYNKVSAKSNVGAVTVIKGEQIQNLPNRSFDKSLQGFVPGLLVTQGTGQPGGGTSNFVLRGIATGANPDLFGTARNPLIVMDGIPLSQDQQLISTSTVASYANPLAQLNPSDIETITVLKDAAAIALYGSKASNGVLLVNTKKGKEGKTRIGFRHQTDIAERLKSNQDMLNQQQYLELLYETYKNTDPVQWTDAAILADLKAKFPVKTDGSFYKQTDWLNELYRSGALSISNELSVSGGNARQTFYLNLEYSTQNGVEKNTGFDRTSIRFNYENRPASWIKLGLNSTSSYSVQKVGMGWSEGGAMRISPLNPVRDENGDFIYNYAWGGPTSYSLTTSYSYWANPASVQQLNFNNNTSFRSMSKLYGEIKFLKYFSFTPNLGADLMVTETKWKVHPALSIGYGYGAGSGSISGSAFRTANLISSNVLRFDRTIAKKHSINILAAHEAQVRTSNSVGVTMMNIGSNPLTEELQTGTLSGGGGFGTKETLLSYFGQLNYGLLDRYFISGSIRTDGSSLFGENRRFGSHWSAGAGWIVSAEPFMQAASGWLNYLKIRGSVGSAGNSAAIINTMRYHRLLLFQFLGAGAIRSDQNSPPNPGIKWEKTFSWNTGLDVRLFKERLSLTADVYNRQTADLIGTVALAPATGYYSLRTNLGNLKNYGVELTFSAVLIKTTYFRWSLGGNWSMNKNRLVKSTYVLESTSDVCNSCVDANSIIANGQGKNYNSFYLVQWAGVDPVTGRPQWIDSTGKRTSDWYAAKPAFVGKPQPDGFGSFSQTLSWKNISLSMMVNYQYDLQIYLDPSGNSLVNEGIDPFVNQGQSALDRWQKPGDIASNPRRLLFGNVNGDYDNSNANSTRYLLDGDFIRLSNVSLSYQLPKQLLERLHLSSGNIYLQGNNLATWTKYSGRQDPENTSATGKAYSVYPLQRSFSLGLNLNF